jgi:hypothetical protein
MTDLFELPVINDSLGPVTVTNDSDGTSKQLSSRVKSHTPKNSQESCGEGGLTRNPPTFSTIKQQTTSLTNTFTVD